MLKLPYVFVIEFGEDPIATASWRKRWFHLLGMIRLFIKEHLSGHSQLLKILFCLPFGLLRRPPARIFLDPSQSLVASVFQHLATCSFPVIESCNVPLIFQILTVQSYSQQLHQVQQHRHGSCCTSSAVWRPPQWNYDNPTLVLERNVIAKPYQNWVPKQWNKNINILPSCVL